MLGILEAGQVSADLRQHREGGGDINAVNAGQVHAAQLEQMAAQVELGGIFGLASAFSLAGFSCMVRQRFQHGFELPVTVGQLPGIGVVQGHGLLECEQVFLAPVALQGLGDVGFTSTNTGIAQLGQRRPVTFAGEDRPDDFLPGFARHIGNHLGQLDVHLR